MLVFDLDGTISDPLEGMAKSINHALEHFGYPKRTFAELAKYVGPPLSKSFVEMTGVDDPSPLIAKYRERYSETGYAENVMYAGMKEVLIRLRNAGAPMAMCTAKPEVFTRKILAMFGIADFFPILSCHPVGLLGIPKGEQLRQMMVDGAIDDKAVMIGDRDVDIIAAKQNGLASCGVLWGYGARQELETHSPTYLARAPEDILTIPLANAFLGNRGYGTSAPRCAKPEA